MTGCGLQANSQIGASVQQTAERPVAGGEDRRSGRVDAPIAGRDPYERARRHMSDCKGAASADPDDVVVMRCDNLTS